MRDALNKTGRPIFYAIAKGDLSDLAPIACSISNSWRPSIKVLDPWGYTRSSFQVTNYYADIQTTGCFNDPDYLYVGLKKLSADEERSQFALYSIAKAPLFISADLS
jgi:alpha-galactosidase